MAVTPRQLQDQLTAISEESYQLHQELAEISCRSADAKFELMKDGSNGKRVDMLYAASVDGKRENYLKIYLKGLSHKRTSIIQELKANAGHSW